MKSLQVCWFVCSKKISLRVTLDPYVPVVTIVTVGPYVQCGEAKVSQEECRAVEDGWSLGAAAQQGFSCTESSGKLRSLDKSSVQASHAGGGGLQGFGLDTILHY